MGLARSPHDRRLTKLLSGTTTVGVVCKDGVVLGTDRRATAGYFIAHKHVKKIVKIDEHVAATMAGVVAEAQKVLERVSAEARLYRYMHGRPMPVRAIATLLANMLFGARYFPYIIQAIIAGVDDEGPSMYTLDWFGTLTKETYIATGSGSPMALGLLEDEYHEGITIEEAVPLVVRAINSAMRRDPGSGEGVDIVVITESEGVRELSPEELEKYLKARKGT